MAYILIILLAIIAVVFVAPILFLALGLACMWHAFQVLTSKKASNSKASAFIIGAVGIMIVSSTFPSVFGLLAIIGIYFLIKALVDKKRLETNGPREAQWREL